MKLNSLFLINFFLGISFPFTAGFGQTTVHVKRSPRCSVSLSLALSDDRPLRDIEMPLLDLMDSDEYNEKIVTPLPSSHLPAEIRSQHLYGMQLRRPVHKMLLQEAMENTSTNDEQTRLVYGHVAKKNDDGQPWIGCTAQIVLKAQEDDPSNKGSDVGDDIPLTVLVRGGFRFVVKEVIKTFPYPVALVDELRDDDPRQRQQEEKASLSEDDKDDSSASSPTLDTSMLVRRIMMGLNKLVTYKLESSSTGNMSPLEQAILEDSGVPVQAQESQAEEMAAVWDVFQSGLVDICPLPVDRYYSIAMMAAELLNFDNDLRAELLCTTDGVARLRTVLAEVERQLSWNQARKVASEITDDNENDDSRNLKVGEPQLPPWSRSITDGTRIEYYWNEEWGWCAGVVVGQPQKIVDELIVTVRFDEDGEEHRLPFRGDEKVRWRPPQK